VCTQHAQEAAHAELAGTDPNVSAIHEQHLVHEAGADDILAGWTGNSAIDAPPDRRAIASPPAPRKDSTRPSTGDSSKGQSATDRLNS
jgi:hypothetical protein